MGLRGRFRTLKPFLLGLLRITDRVGVQRVQSSWIRDLAERAWAEAVRLGSCSA